MQATDAKTPGPTARVLIFANPVAGRGAGARLGEALHDRLRRDGLGVRLFLQKPREVSDAELAEPAQAAVVIGGDGTLRGVAERLIQADRLVPLLAAPLGTANLMGRHLGIATNEATLPDRVSFAIARGQIRLLDAGRANGQLFLLMAGVGFDARIVYHLDRLRKGPIRAWDYFVPAVLSLWEETAPPLRVTLDGQEVFPQQRGMAIVGNLSEYGAGFPVLPFAKGDDGLLDVCVMPCASRAELVRLFLLAAAGEHVRAEGVVYLRGTHVRIESPEAVPVQVDGEPAGHTPVEINLLPVRLPFIVP